MGLHPQLSVVARSFQIAENFKDYCGNRLLACLHAHAGFWDMRVTGFALGMFWVDYFGNDDRVKQAAVKAREQDPGSGDGNVGFRPATLIASHAVRVACRAWALAKTRAWTILTLRLRAKKLEEVCQKFGHPAKDAA